MKRHRRHRLVRLGRDLRARPALGARRGMGRNHLRAERARCRAVATTGRSFRSSRSAAISPTARKRFLATLQHIAPDAARDRGALPQQSRRAALLLRRAAQRSADAAAFPAWNWLGLKPRARRRAARRAVHQLPERLGARPRDAQAHPTALSRARSTATCTCWSWAVQPSGLRTLRPLPNVAEWCGCFDLLQMNEDEMAMMAPDPMALAATAMRERRAQPDRHARQARRRLLRGAGLRATRRSCVAPRPLGARGRSGAHRARSRRRTSIATAAIPPDAATFGARPISLGCSPVIT